MIVHPLKALLGLGIVLLSANRVGAQFVESTRVLHEFSGAAANDQFGWVSAPMADVNGDGADEVIVTAPFHDAGGVNAGRVYLYSGRTGAELFHWDGAAGEQNGISVRDAGDVDNDTINDIISGAPSAGGIGRVYVYSGADGHLIHSIQIGVAGDQFGSAVCGVGDINGDGHDDLAIGAERHDATGTDSGRVYVISGRDGSTVLWTIDGVDAGDHFGNAVANASDVTGDGYDDLIVGAPMAGPTARGRAYLYSIKDRVRRFEMTPDSTAVNFAQYFVAGVGDTNGDHIGDLYVADFNDSQNGGSAGKAYVFSGVDGARLLTLRGSRAGEGFGIGRGCGDVNFDGRADLIMCGWINDEGAVNAGKADIISGADGTVIRSFTSTTAGESFGFDAHGVGDVDGDGRLDFFVTAAYNGINGFHAGKCYLISGGLTLQPPDPGLVGQPNALVANGAAPGNRVYFGYGFSRGTIPVPGCPGAVISIRNVQVAGSAPVNALGNARFAATVPGGISGRTVLLQALERSDCAVSNVVEHLFP